MLVRRSPRLFRRRLVSLALLCTSVVTFGLSAEPILPSSAAQPGDQSGTWKTKAPAALKRTEVAAAALAGKIYVAGGFAELSLSNIASLTVSDAVEVYDPQADAWTTAAPLPTRLHHAGVVAVGKHLYVIGGFTPKLLALWSPVATAYRYDPAADTWTELAPMPTPRGALGVAAIGEDIYAVGGIGESGDTGTVEVYDTATNSWSVQASLPTPRDHLAVAAVDGRLYAIGGRLNGSYSNNVGNTDVYDPSTDQWTLVAPLPTPRSGIAAAVINKRIYVVGGEAPEGTFHTNEAYSPATGTWHAMAPMPTARHGLGAAVVDGRLYVMSGGPTPGGSYSNVNEQYLPSAHHLSRMNRSRANPAQVETVMALLAAFEDAGALPPEGSPEATQLIRALIQFQAAFMKSADPSITRLLLDALKAKDEARATAAFDEFRANGWTSHSLEAVIEYADTRSVWNDPDLVKGFETFNIGRPEFEVLSRTFFKARAQLASRGQDLHAVYAKRRGDMPSMLL